MEAFTNSTSEPDLRTSNITHAVHVNGIHVTFETTSEESMTSSNVNPTTTVELVSDGVVDSESTTEGMHATTGSEGNGMTMTTYEMVELTSTQPFDAEDDIITTITTSPELESSYTSLVNDSSTQLPSDETRFTDYEEITTPEAVDTGAPEVEGILGKTENKSTSLNSKRRNPNVERNGLCTWNYRWLIYSGEYVLNAEMRDSQRCERMGGWCQGVIRYLQLCKVRNVAVTVAFVCVGI